MDFYVSWYPGDPIYPAHDPDCALLISITSVARDWIVDYLPNLPKKLLIDSGGYRFAAAPNEALSPAQVLQRQITLLNGAEIPTIICARDYPLLDKSISANERDKSITQTIAFAYELKTLIDQNSLGAWITPMAVIQGNDTDSLAYCAKELQAIGFPLYGLGSLAELRQHGLILERVQTVADIVGAEKLHIFGIGAVQTARTLRKMGINSLDSSRPAKAAAYNEILYSDPYRRFGILEPEGAPLKGRIARHKRLQRPLPCDCPACREDPEQIIIVGKRANIRSRALHNYYHLKRLFIAPHTNATSHQEEIP
jgi:7-cyano-7-deazaguanine tRNA-ribosyltransferase